MTYHKRVAKKRKCAHCGDKFLSNHKSRIYCSQSCNTLAWRARRAPEEEAGSLPAVAAGPGLAFSARNVGMLTLSSALGTLLAQLGTSLTQQVLYAGTPLDLLRAELRAGLAQLGVPPGADTLAGPGGGALAGAPAQAATQALRAAALSPAQEAALVRVLAAPLADPDHFAAFDHLLQQPWPSTTEP